MAVVGTAISGWHLTWQSPTRVDMWHTTSNTATERCWPHAQNAGFLIIGLWSMNELSAFPVTLHWQLVGSNFPVVPFPDDLTFHINAVIGILEDLESHLSETSNWTSADLFWELSCPEHDFCQHFHGPVNSVLLDLPSLSKKQRIFLKHLMNHTVDDSLVEHGVLLTPDGTTVSLSPVLAGIAAGLRRRHDVALPTTPLLAGHLNRTKVDPLLASLAKDLARGFLFFHANQSHLALGPNGCWDSISAPQTFTLMGSPSHLPDALINGAMDGLILSTYLIECTDPPSNLSTLLSYYYSGDSLPGDSQLRSNFRRKNFAALVSEDTLRDQVESSLHQLWRQNETSSIFEDIESQELKPLAKEAVDDFMALYVGMCLVGKLFILLGPFD